MLTCGPMSAKRKSAEDEAVDGDATQMKKKKILQRYRDLYREIWPTLTRSQRGEYYVCCTTFSTDFSCSHAGKNDTLSLKLARNFVLYTDLSSFLTKSSTETDTQESSHPG